MKRLQQVCDNDSTNSCDNQ